MTPARTLLPVKLPRTLPRPRPDHVIVTAYGSVTDNRVALAIRIAVETGLRRAEIAHLRPADVEGWHDVWVPRMLGPGSGGG